MAYTNQETMKTAQEQMKAFIEYDPESVQWVADIRSDGKTSRIGYFATEELANEAARKALSL